MTDSYCISEMNSNTETVVFQWNVTDPVVQSQHAHCKRKRVVLTMQALVTIVES